MTTQTQPLNTIDRVRGMMARNSLNQSQMGRFLGIPQGTIGNWLGGTRTPNKVVSRMLDVLEQAEMFYPTLFRTLLTQEGRKALAHHALEQVNDA